LQVIASMQASRIPKRSRKRLTTGNNSVTSAVLPGIRERGGVDDAPTATGAPLPRERVRCVPGMLNSSEVKGLYST
jgi:hypothetical protein